MSGFNNAGWISRLWALGKPGAPTTEYVQNVNLVNDRRYASSREHAPHAAHAGFLTAPAAGTHNFVELGGSDALAAVVNLLHYMRVELSQANQLTGLLRIALADGAALTTATRTAVAPMFLDSDPDVVPALFEGTITTANIPASAEILPKSGSLGQTNATPAYPTAITELKQLGALPFALSWLGPRRLILFGGDAEIMEYFVAWQAMRS